MQKKSEKIIFTLYLLGFLALALTLALLQPLANTPPLYGNPPDEHARYLIPQFICKYGKIPTGWEEEVRIPAYGFSYALYNVFPYIVQGYLMRFVSLFTESEVVLLYTARLVNVTFGLLMAVVVYEYGFLLYVIHGHDGICSGMHISGWYKSPQQSVDERWYYFVCSFLL